MGRASVRGKDETEQEDDVGESPRHVVILGAGFSKAVGCRMPTSDELGVEVRERLEASGNGLPVELTKGSFEEWLSRLAEDQPDLLEHENLQGRRYFSLISRTIAEIIQEREDEVTQGGDWPPTWLRAFIGVAHGRRATVITFNYDMLLERAVNACRFSDLDMLWDGRVRSCDVLSHLPPRADQSEGGPYSTFRLLKLHGSVSFHHTPGDPMGGSLVRWPLSDEGHLSAPIQSPFEAASATSLPGKTETDDERKQRLLFGREPFIVPPAASKNAFYGMTFVRGLWRQAREAIREADHVHLVGYSLPETDLVTVGLLRENLGEHACVAVVNRPGDHGCEEVAKRARRLLRCDVTPIYPDSDEAITHWAAQTAEDRSRDTLKSLISDVYDSGVSDNSERDVHVIALTDYGEDQWCVEQSEPGEALGCVNVVKPPQIPIARQPRWQVGNFLQALRTLADSGSPFVVDFDGDKKLVVVAKVEPPASSTSYEYRIQLQVVPGS
jgi:hypothetical protein